MSAYADAIRADSPSGYWRLNETSGTIVHDSSGNPNQGTIAGGVTINRPGALADGDPAMTFNGSTGYIDVPPGPSLLFTTALTAEVWLNMSSYSSGTALSQTNVANTNGWQINVQYGGPWLVQFQVSIGGVSHSCLSSTGGYTLLDNAWVHVVGTFDGATMRLYVNGILNSTTAFSGTLNVTGTDVLIGIASFGRPFAGSLDEAAVYPHVLSAGRIAAHYAAASQISPSYPTYTLEIAFNNNATSGWALDSGALDGATATLGGVYQSAIFQNIPGFISATTHRGRQMENQLIEAGRLSVTMDNAAGNLSPDNTASPYSPNVISGRLIRLSMVYQGVTYPLFVGYTESYMPVDNGEMDGNCVITAHDWIGKANRRLLSETFPVQDEGARVTALLNLVDDGGFTRVIDAGPENVLPASFSTKIGTGAAPTIAPTLAVGAGTSSLRAGNYAVSYTWTDSSSRESLPSTAANITIAANQTILVTLPSRPTGITWSNIYMSVDETSAFVAFMAQVGGTTYTAPGYASTGALPPPVTQPGAITVHQHMNDIMLIERGIYYTGADGTHHYENRHYRFNHTRSQIPQGTFSQPLVTGLQPAGTIPFLSIAYLFDDSQIFNDIHVHASSTTEVEQVSQDSTSITLFDAHTLSVQSAYLSPGYAVYLAAWLLAGYKDQHSRINAVRLDGDISDGTGTATDAWVQIGSREISDRIHIVKNRPASLNVNRDMWIEGVEHTIKANNAGHEVSWLLGDPLAYGPQSWTLDSSLLDSTAILSGY